MSCPRGTLLNVKLLKGLTTKTTTAGTEFEGQIAEAVLRDGQRADSGGSVLTGLVTEVHGGKRISGTAMLHLRPESVTLPDGVRYAVTGQVVDTDQYHATKVDGEGSSPSEGSWAADGVGSLHFRRGRVHSGRSDPRGLAGSAGRRGCRAWG